MLRADSRVCFQVDEIDRALVSDLYGNTKVSILFKTPIFFCYFWNIVKYGRRIAKVGGCLSNNHLKQIPRQARLIYSYFVFFDR